jgi:uncharacterized membrane protein YdjX (TVP38/TMEM64 family)
MDPEAIAPADAGVAASIRRSYGKRAVLVLCVGAALVLLHATPLRSLVTDIQLWKARLAAAGPLAAAGFFVASALLVAFGIPRLLMAGLAGVLFGAARGFFMAFASAVVGAYGLFLFARWGGRDWARRRLALSPRVRDLLSHPNWGSVVLFRQLPVVGLVQNAALALTELSHREFLGGTAIGILPSTLLVALIGSGAGKASLKASLTALSLSMILLGLLALGGIRWRNARAKNAPGWNARTAR